MDKQRSEIEVVPGWFLDQKQHRFIARHKGVNRLRCAVLLKFLETEARFPGSYDEVCAHRLQELCSVLKISSEELGAYDPQNGTSIRHRAAIRSFLGFRSSTTSDYNVIQTWLTTDVIETPDQERILHGHIKTWCLANKVELPASTKQERIINGSVTAFERVLFANIFRKLPTACCDAIDAMFSSSNETMAIFSVLKSDAGKPSLESIFTELSKLSDIDALALPEDLFAEIPKKTVQSYRLRAASESSRDMRRHPEPVRYALAAAFISELSSNQLANQEISILALHLLQTCLVYVNTLMIQQVLEDKKWSGHMNKHDYRALTLLIYQHVMPYGAFDLDMSKRLLPDPIPDGLKLAA